MKYTELVPGNIIYNKYGDVQLVISVTPVPKHPGGKVHKIEFLDLCWTKLIVVHFIDYESQWNDLLANGWYFL